MVFIFLFLRLYLYLYKMVLVEWFKQKSSFCCSSQNSLVGSFFLPSFLTSFSALIFGSSNIFFGIFTPFYYLFIICFTFFFTFCLSKRSSRMWIKRTYVDDFMLHLCFFLFLELLLLFWNMLLVYSTEWGVRLSKEEGNTETHHRLNILISLLCLLVILVISSQCSFVWATILIHICSLIYLWYDSCWLISINFYAFGFFVFVVIQRPLGPLK